MSQSVISCRGERKISKESLERFTEVYLEMVKDNQRREAQRRSAS
jgi:hypothetical protein